MDFFIPNAEDTDKQEQYYEEFAEACGRRPLPKGERIQSISWIKDTTETWTATVGQQLSGKKKVTRGRGRAAREYLEPLSDPATVLAIFPGIPYMVVTNRGMGSKSRWVNPFMASDSPCQVTLFDAGTNELSK